MFWRAVVLGLMLLSVAILGWALWPNAMDTATLKVAWPPLGEKAESEWSVSLRTPARLRLGETGTAMLVLKPDAKARASNALNILVEASLELPGFVLSPAATQIQSLPTERELTFTWQITARRVGKVSGVVPVNLQQYASDGSLIGQYLLSAQPLEIKTEAWLGLDYTVVRFLGLLGVTGSIVGWLVIVIRKV